MTSISIFHSLIFRRFMMRYITTTFTTPTSASDPIKVNIGANGILVSWIINGSSAQTISLSNITNSGSPLSLGSFTPCCIASYESVPLPGGGSIVNIIPSKTGAIPLLPHWLRMGHV
jgi:hypothetical protein